MGGYAWVAGARSKFDARVHETSDQEDILSFSRILLLVQVVLCLAGMPLSA